MKALVIGATGATGKDLVDTLLNDDDFKIVHCFVRRPLEIYHPKLTYHVVDFDRPEEWKNLITGEIAFSSLGTTLKQAGSKEAQKKVDFQYQSDFAKAAKENGVSGLVLVSSYGANPKSKIFYTRIKGQLEEEVKQLHFEHLTIFQPGMLDRKNSNRPGEVLGAKILKFANKLGILESYKPLDTQILAKAMVNAAKIKSSGISTITLGAIKNFSQKR